MPSPPIAHRLCAAALALGLAAATAAASPPSTASGQPIANDTTFNYGMASFLGSGIYSVNGQAVQLYRIPFTMRLDHGAPPEPELYAQLPVTFGFYNFTPTDVLEGSVPHSLDTVSTLAGLELRLRLDDRWRYLQLGAVGYTKAAGNPDRKLVGTQAALERTDAVGSWNTRFRSELLAALSGGGPGGTDNVVRVLEGIEFDRPQSWQVFRHQAAVGTYTVVRYYPATVAFSASRTPIRFESEVGVTCGTLKPVTVFSLPMPRLSVGYRRAGRLDVFFLGFGTPF